MVGTGADLRREAETAPTAAEAAVGQQEKQASCGR